LSQARTSSERAAKRLYLIVALVLLFSVAAFLLLNPDGLLSLSTLRNRVDDAGVSRDSLAYLRDSLRTRAGLLATDTTAIEEAVREILGWARPGEFVIRIDSDSSGSHL
jgi:cell division protein FtsB